MDWIKVLPLMVLTYPREKYKPSTGLLSRVFSGNSGQGVWSLSGGQIRRTGMAAVLPMSEQGRYVLEDEFWAVSGEIFRYGLCCHIKSETR